MDGRRDRQILFYMTLLAEIGDLTISLHQVTGGNTPNLVILPAEAGDLTASLPQVTGGNTLNLVLKRMLRYFLKIPLLKNILQF